VQLAQDRSGAWKLCASAVLPRDPSTAAMFDPAEKRRRISDVLFRRGFRGDQIVLAVPDSKLLTSNLSFPRGRPASV